MQTLIGLSGRIGSGKDTLGLMLKDYYFDKDFRIKKFADKLKDITCILIGCTREQLEDRDFKETPLGEEWTQYFLSRTGRKAPYSGIGVKEALLRRSKAFKGAMYVNQRQMTPRLLLQLLGTEAGREVIHPNTWVNAAFSDYTEGSNWIFTDVRFPNEADAIRKRGGVVVRIERPTELRVPLLWQDFQNSRFDEWDTYLRETKQFDSVYHPSETALDNYDFDFVVDNSGSLKHAWEQLKAGVELCSLGV